MSLIRVFDKKLYLVEKLANIGKLPKAEVCLIYVFLAFLTTIF